MLDIKAAISAQKKKPRWNDATPERLSIANLADLDTEYNEFVSAAGKLERRRQILGVLGTLEKRGLITRIQRDAGQMYLSVVDRATARARLTMAYQISVDNSHSRFDLSDYVEVKASAAKNAKAALQAVYPSSRLALSWLVATMEEDRKISSLGAMYAGPQNEREQAARGLAILKTALDCLAHHYRMEDLVPQNARMRRWLEFMQTART